MCCWYQCTRYMTNTAPCQRVVRLRKAPLPPDLDRCPLERTAILQQSTIGVSCRLGVYRLPRGCAPRYLPRVRQPGAAERTLLPRPAPDISFALSVLRFLLPDENQPPRCEYHSHFITAPPSRPSPLPLTNAFALSHFP